jgi:nucleoside-diphosphate-sugar epimerase
MRDVIAVTGGTGFVGQALVKELIGSGPRIRLLTHKAKASEVFPAGTVEIWEGDLGRPETLAGFVKGVDTVYHLAGEVRNPRLFWTVNAEGTAALADTAKSADVRSFLYLSSVGVIGSPGKAGRVDEKTTVRPRNAYEASKYAGEQAALKAHHDQGMRVSVLRPSIVFGEGQDPERDRFLSWVRTVNNGNFFPLGDRYISSYVYLGDVIGACLKVAGHPESGGQVYIVNQPVPLTEFVDEMADQLGVKTPTVLPRPIGALAANLLRLTGRFGSLYNRTVFAMDKLAGLGFKLPYGYKEGLARTIAWYRREGLLAGKQ